MAFSSGGKGRNAIFAVLREGSGVKRRKKLTRIGKKKRKEPHLFHSQFHPASGLSVKGHSLGGRRTMPRPKRGKKKEGRFNLSQRYHTVSFLTPQMKGKTDNQRRPSLRRRKFFFTGDVKEITGHDFQATEDSCRKKGKKEGARCRRPAPPRKGGEKEKKKGGRGKKISSTSL